jgi:hypothetical protein
MISERETLVRDLFNYLSRAGAYITSPMPLKGVGSTASICSNVSNRSRAPQAALCSCGRERAVTTGDSDSNQECARRYRAAIRWRGSSAAGCDLGNHIAA